MFVVAGIGAEGLQVRRVPEETRVTSVRLAVIGDQLRRVGMDAATSWPLASEPITQQHGPAKLVPPCSLVPGAPWRAVNDALLFGFWVLCVR